MAKLEFRAGKDGNGRVRFFVDGAEHLLDEYVAKYYKACGVNPEIPVGVGGAAAPIVPVAKPEDPAVIELKRRLAELEAKFVPVSEELAEDVLAHFRKCAEEAATAPVIE